MNDIITLEPADKTRVYPNGSADLIIDWNSGHEFKVADTKKKVIHTINTASDIYKSGIRRIQFRYSNGKSIESHFLLIDPFTTMNESDKMKSSKQPKQLKTGEIKMAKKVTEKTEVVEKPAKTGKKAPAETVGKKVAKEVKPEKKAFGPRKPAEGFIGVNELAEELGMEPAALRRKLRKMDSATREEGAAWAWKENSKELAAIKKQLAA